MHTDLELLGLLALGEPAGGDADRAHLDTCPVCALELDELSQLAQLGRTLSPETAMTTPSHDVWARIRTELALDPRLEPPTHRSLFVPSDPLMPPVESPPAHTPRRSLLSAIRSALGTDHAADHAARLVPVDAEWVDIVGSAEVGTDHHGRRLLSVMVDGDLPTYGVRRAWLVHRERPELRQNLGLLDGPHGLWTVEHSLDLHDYAILEIAQHDFDDLGPDGDVILRGELLAA